MPKVAAFERLQQIYNYIMKQITTKNILLSAPVSDGKIHCYETEQ